MPGPVHEPTPVLKALRTLTARHRPIKAGDVHPLSGINQKIAIWVTDKVGSMWAAYAFCLLTLISLPAAIASGSALVIVAWIAQTFFQLVLLPVILVGQAVQATHADARAEQDFEVNQRALAEIEHLLKIIEGIDARTLALVTPKVVDGS